MVPPETSTFRVCQAAGLLTAAEPIVVIALPLTDCSSALPAEVRASRYIVEEPLARAATPARPLLRSSALTLASTE
jgi:hypothetical protein